ncbi:hypothetical protein [Bacteroides graminisolvens]|uniref:lipopolysaccharide biosynthesis protein n=1 Tax=Bacteroides graminisolvens TaxID=477666 RepID=UPI0029C6511E|nr:hypothetical protein [Bacteroides graminisolvens]
MNLVNLFRNKVVFYLSSRYITYLVQFVTSLLIADKLGPYYLGVWGFVLLLLNYFGQIHFGISTSFNILYIHNKDNEYKKNCYIANSLTLNGYLAVAVILIYIVYLCSGGTWFEKYECDKYFLLVCVIAVLQYFQQFLTFLFRVKNKLGLVALCQSLIVVLNFAAVLLFAGENLVYGLTFGYFFGYLTILIIAFFTRDYPCKGTFKISLTCQKEIFTKGLSLFLFNSCFYFIVISVRSLVSANYSVEEFGIFTFSFTMAQAVMLLVESLNFIIFPKVVHRLSSPDNKEVFAMLESYRIAYITSSHFLIYIALLFFPLLLLLLPKYSDGLISLNLIALSVLMNTCSAGYSTLLISRNKEVISAFLSAGALVLNILLALCLIKLFGVTFDYVILATLVTYLFYAIAVTYFGYRELGVNKLVVTLKTFFPFRMMVPYLCALLICIMKIESLIWIPVLVFVFLNTKDIKSVISMGKTIIQRPNTVDFK